MTRPLSLLFFLLSFVMGVNAADYNNGIFKYSISNGEVTIKKYTGSSPLVSIPGFLDGYPVTTIYNLSFEVLDSPIEEIFIPESVTQYTGNIVNLKYNNKIKTIVLENGHFSIKKDNYPFYFSDFNIDHFDNFIILDTCDKTAEELTGKSNADSYILKPGIIKICIKNQSELTVQTYLFGQSRKTVFDQTRLDYLLSALQKHGIALEDIVSIDLSQMSLPGKTINFNLTYFSAIPNAQVITHKTTIDDTAATYNPQEFSGLISYHRENTALWNTVCLPFKIKESDFPEGTKIYQMSSDEETAINLTRIDEGATLPAGTPCFIWSPEDATEWNLSINGNIAANIAAGTNDLNYWSLQGSFETRELGTGYYKLNSKGDAFVMTTEKSHVYPFRCYIAPKQTNSSSPARLNMGIDEEASITLVPNDAEPQQVKLYDLMGRPRQGNASGLFVPAKR